MSPKPSLACRHPKVIMIFDNEDDILGAASIIAEQVEDYRTLSASVNIGEKIKELKPSVILFALATVEKSIELYTKVITDKSLDYPHQSILLCKNRESGVAFRCCIKGLFDNYFVYQPLYEKFRLKMIVHNGLLISQTTEQYIGYQEEQLENVDKDLAQLIDDGGACKQSLLNSIDKCKKSLNKSNEAMIEKEVDTKQDTRQLIDKINKQHIEPLLAELECNIKSTLDSMINQLIAKQDGLTDLKEQTSLKNRVQVPDQAKIIEALALTPTQQASHNDAIEQTELKKILVVEDNQIYRNMLVNILKKEQFNVDAADDGLHALKKIKQNNYSLVLMDLFMPNLDGINTTIQIKSASGGKKLPIIALTGNKNKELIKTWAEQGLKGYILKPSSKSEILEAVHRIIN
ncbi:response regulator [Shewanella nanhaiensis]|uniref:Response regulator n=1 Tax=Shewanella nanhaiensis TaxID=2864872 RepID=A0ABS7E140_9GAMM|nr:response regulator [Shewanella nanhaiensis]MBW8183428.1 response regulator [Shewanella nanhaiensis]